MNGKPSDSPAARDRALTEVAFTAAMDRIAALEAELAEAWRVAEIWRNDAIRERDAAQAEAAALRLVLEDDERGLPLTVAALERREQALAGDAGRAIAERVPLWRELEAAVRDEHGRYGVSDETSDVLDKLDKLAALDEKGGGQ